MNIVSTHTQFYDNTSLIKALIPLEMCDYRNVVLLLKALFNMFVDL